MQLLKNKLLLAILLALSLFTGSFTKAVANSPDVRGSVTFADGRSIPNILIKWVDERGSFRYTTTDSSGNFLFKSWSFDATRDEISDANGDPLMIDTNYDGSPDSPVWGYGNNISRKGEAFNCLSNQQTFSVIPMPNMAGTFTNSSQTIAINNNTTTYVNFVFEPTKPSCPNNIQVSCNKETKTATASWDPYPNSLRYNLMARTYPLSNMIKTTDIYREGSWVKQEFPIELNTNYLVSVETVKEVGGTTYFSGYCSQDFLCQGECSNQAPTADLAARLCPADSQQNMPDTGFWADFTLKNIDLKGNAFAQSDLMLSFNYSTATQAILDFLGTPTYSAWSAAGRTKQTGDWFIYALQQTTSLSGGQIYTRIDDNSKIGNKTVKEFRGFLKANKFNTVYKLTANLRTACGDYQPFNDRISADSTISFIDCSETPPPPPPPTPQSCDNPVITSQADGMAVLDKYGRLTIAWSPKVSATKTYQILVYDKNNPAYTTPAAVFKTWDAPKTNLNPEPKDITAKVVVATAGSVKLLLSEQLQTADKLGLAIRDSYTTEDGEVCPAQGVEAKRAFTISGNFYNNPACVEDANLLQSLTNSSVKSGGVVGELSNNGKSYSMTIPFQSQSSIVSLDLASPLYTCAESCNPSGTVCVKSDIAPPAAGTDQNVNVPFFVDADTTFADSWWNVYGGHVFAENTIKSILPNPSASGDKFLIEPQLGEGEVSTGIPIINLGSFQIGEGGYLTHRNPQLQVTGAAVLLTTNADYQFFKSAVGEISPTIAADTITTPATQMGSISQGDLKVHYKDSDLTFAPIDAWGIPAGEHHLVLVNGNLIFSGANSANPDSPSLVETPVGSTVTFAVSGTITIEGSVGNTTVTTPNPPNLEGIFVADQIVIADSPAGEDRRFVGAGSFYGWSGVELNRKYDDVDLNADYPTESFIYRPDFVINYPEALRNSSLTWREVN